MAIYLGYNRVGIIKTVKVKVFANTTTVSGTYSVVLNNSIGDEVDQLVIDGNSVQSGTPTPETPIEIESVGDKTKNLFDKNNIYKLVNIIPGSSTLESFIDSNSLYISIEGGKTYTVSGSKFSRFVVCSTIDKPNISVDISNRADLGAVTPSLARRSLTITANKNAKYLVVRYYYKSTDIYSEQEILDTIQIEENNTATDYEPYGYKIPIVSKGKNLLDATKAETGSLVAADGSNYEKTNRARSPFVYLKKGNYTISMSSEISATTMFFYSKPEPSGYFIGKYATTPVVENGIRFAKFPVEQDCYMRCVFVPEDESKTTDLGATTLANYNVMVAETQNLFDISKAENGTLASQNGSDLSVEQYPNRCRSGFIYLTAGSYIISFSELISTGNYLHRYSSNNQSSWLGSLTFTKNGSVSKFTLDSDCYIRFTIQPINTSSSLVLNTETLKEYQPQLLKSITATDYESYIIPREYNIYLKEPLRKIGDYADILDYKNSKVIRKIKEKVFDGTEELGKLASVQTGLFNYTYYKLGSINSIVDDINLSNLLKYQADFSYQRDGHNTMRVLNTSTYNEARFVFRFHINGANVFEPATVKNLLADFHSQGNPLKLYYAPTTPTEEYIELPMILTRDVETVFEVDTEIKPTKLEVSYWEEIK